jgi:nucleoside-diphosphate-sugar epimerase
VGEPFIDAEDIADVAVAALTEDGHAGRLYELTGPRLLTFGQAIEEIARAAGREVRFVSVSMEQYASLLAEVDVPAEFVWLLTYLFTEVLDGRNAHLTDGVQRALGREPRDFTDYARAAAATGIWGGSGPATGSRSSPVDPDDGVASAAQLNAPAGASPATR